MRWDVSLARWYPPSRFAPLLTAALDPQCIRRKPVIPRVKHNRPYRNLFDLLADAREDVLLHQPPLRFQPQLGRFRQRVLETV